MLVIESRIPKPEELVVLDKRLLDATITIGKSLEECKLAKYRVAAPAMMEKKLEREAKIGLKLHPVEIRSYRGQFNVNGSKLDVHGDLQIKVGDWEWGDPLDFYADYVYVVGVKVPVVPLQLKSEIYNGLGWRDRATKIHEAVIRSRHKFG